MILWGSIWNWMHMPWIFQLMFDQQFLVSSLGDSCKHTRDTVSVGRMSWSQETWDETNPALNLQQSIVLNIPKSILIQHLLQKTPWPMCFQGFPLTSLFSGVFTQTHPASGACFLDYDRIKAEGISIAVNSEEHKASTEPWTWWTSTGTWMKFYWYSMVFIGKSWQLTNH